MATGKKPKSQNVKAIVTIEQTVGGLLKNVLSAGIDEITDLAGKSLLLELVSNELDPRTNSEKKTIKGYAHKTDKKENNEVVYEAKFEVAEDFGEVGAIVIENENHKEIFLKNVAIDGFNDHHGPLHFTCNSWIHSKQDSSVKRVFFTDKSYLPSETPSGLRSLREEELEVLRGNGEGERKRFERIYDYDVYNDLGDPDTNIDSKRPVLGGKQRPYPRRCRTGRKHSTADPLSETRSASVYVPRDEAFAEIKQTQFTETTVSSGLSVLIESLNALLKDQNLVFSSFEDIEMLFKEGFTIPPLKGSGGLLQRVVPQLIKAASDTEQVLRFDAPETIKKDRFFWLSDEEFARETLAGVNPYSIKLVKEWPLRSKLDPQIYGSPESAITREVIEQQLNGYNTVEEDEEYFNFDRSVFQINR